VPLLPPRVVAPLSECSSAVWIQGQVTGATVEIFADGSPVGSGVATWSDQLFALTAGVTLAAGAKVTARQTLGADTSPASPDPLAVQARPPVVGPVAYRSQLYVCGECMWLGGMVPGATFETRVGGALRSAGTSHTGEIHVHLSAPTAPGEIFETQQTACGIAGVPTPSPAPDGAPITEERPQLEPPVVAAPLRECQRTATVRNLYEGSQVTLDRSGGPDATGCPITKSQTFFTSPLVLGETVTARQEFPACRLKSPDAAPVTVQSAEPVPPPSVRGPLCADATSVTLGDLLPGSKVEILESGTPLGTAEAHADTATFPVPPLGAGSVITARQELCGIWSAESDGVAVDPRPTRLPRPIIPGPLFECASVVRVTNLRPGVRVTVESTLLGAPIGEQMVFATEADVVVAPLLIEGDAIFAVQSGCGTSRSRDQAVLPAPELIPPRVERPLNDCMTAVTVADVVPGARVDVYVNSIWRGSVDAGAATVQVSVSARLRAGDRVKARQRLCTDITAFGREVIVEEYLGRWAQVGGPAKAEILAVHAALLRTGKIAYFGGDQHTQSLNTSGDVDHTRVFDCATHAITTVTGLALAGVPPSDIFCSGHSLLPDGRLLVAGGTKSWTVAGPDPHGHGPADHFLGSRDSWLFNPASNSWTATGKLNQQRATAAADPDKTGGRWYPTVITLANGSALAVSGHPGEQDSRHNNSSLELYSATSGTWSLVGTVDYVNIDQAVGRGFEYPRMHVLPGGDVFSATPMLDGRLERWTPYSNPTSWSPVTGGVPDPIYDSLNSTSVLLPLIPSDGYRAKVLICGGTTAFILDFGASPLAWTATPPRRLTDHPSPGDVNPERRNLQATLLPTGEVFVSGGAKNIFDDNTGVRRAEMYDPVGNSWKTLPEATAVRNYHSVALLMPNGAVWVAGSNKNSSHLGLHTRELGIEIFEPWYFCRRRPVITASPPEVSFGAVFEVRTAQATDIGRVAVVRAGSVTHNFNPDQRYVGLDFTHVGGGRLAVTAPPNGTVAVPGYYLLFVIDREGVPSEGKFIRIPGRRRRRSPKMSAAPPE
jgi:Domain of unknown function (DUF1929)